MPVCSIAPNPNSVIKFWKWNQEPSIEKSILPSFAYNCWDIESILAKAASQGGIFTIPWLYFLKSDVNFLGNTMKKHATIEGHS